MVRNKSNLDIFNPNKNSYGTKRFGLTKFDCILTVSNFCSQSCQPFKISESGEEIHYFQGHGNRIWQECDEAIRFSSICGKVPWNWMLGGWACSYLNADELLNAEPCSSYELLCGTPARVEFLKENMLRGDEHQKYLPQAGNYCRHRGQAV